MSVEDWPISIGRSRGLWTFYEGPKLEETPKNCPKTTVESSKKTISPSFISTSIGGTHGSTVVSEDSGIFSLNFATAIYVRFAAQGLQIR